DHSRSSRAAALLIDAILQRADNVSSRDNTSKAMIVVYDEHSSNSMIDHQFKNPRQLRLRPDIDELRTHKVAGHSLHQVIITRHHASGRKNKAGKKVIL